MARDDHQDDHDEASTPADGAGYSPQAGSPSHPDRTPRPGRAAHPDLLPDMQRRVWRRVLIATGWWAVMFTLTHWPKLGTGGGLDVPYADKLGHFVLFFGWFVLYAWALGWLGWSRRRIVVTLLVAGALYGAIDETTQAFVPGRTPSVLDFAFDVLGMLAGWGVVLAIEWRRRSRPGIIERRP